MTNEAKLADLIAKRRTDLSRDGYTKDAAIIAARGERNREINRLKRVIAAQNEIAQGVTLH